MITYRCNRYRLLKPPAARTRPETAFGTRLGVGTSLAEIMRGSLIDLRILPFGTSRRESRRGFTLIEVVVVVVIIGVLATLAIPALSERMRDRRAQQAALEVATLYRNARTRALARGAAVMVRFDSTVDSGSGRIEVRESIQGNTVAGAAAGCAPLPGGGCNAALNQWDDGATTNQVLTAFEPGIRSEFQNVVIRMRGAIAGPPAELSNFDVCFSPVGSAFVRTNTAAAFSRMTSVAVADVGRVVGANPLGLQREVVIPPTGAARLGL